MDFCPSHPKLFAKGCAEFSPAHCNEQEQIGSRDCKRADFWCGHQCACLLRLAQIVYRKSAGSMPKLVIKPGTPQAQDFELKPGKNYIGRGFANDLKLEDASVSSSHAVIEVNGHVVTITDLGSTNGTRINQLPATGSPLQSGQILKLGAIELLFMTDAAAPGGPNVVPLPPTTAAAQIATEFVIRDPSRVGVAPVAPPPPPAPVPVIGELRIPRITP